MNNTFSRPDPPSQQAFPIAKPGYPLIGAAAFVTIIFALLELTFLALVSLVITLFICSFFRDPDRLAPTDPGAVVSPADGRIVTAELTDTNPFLEGKCLKISIFMNVFNVHVNRIPHEGKISGIQYYPGKFLVASLNEASAENERNAVLVETGDGKKFCVVQVAGLVARRIICGVQEGEDVIRGQRFGMICFGSRLDVYLPENSKLYANIGDKVQAGASILAFMGG